MKRKDMKNLVRCAFLAGIGFFCFPSESKVTITGGKQLFEASGSITLGKGFKCTKGGEIGFRMFKNKPY